MRQQTAVDILQYHDVMTRRLAEVARKVGVSEATVSRVLNGKPGVAESTRQAVLTALDVLGYERPSKLRGERARLVGLVLPELQNPIFPAIAEVDGRRSCPARVHPGPVHADRGRGLGGRLRRAAAPAAGLGRGVRRRPVRPGGCAPRPLRAAGRARAAHGPGQRSIEGLGFPRVSCDDAVAVDQAMAHLLSLGHTSIGILAGPLDHIPSRRKIAAAQVVAKKAGIALGPTGSPTPGTRSRPPRPAPLA